MPNNAKINFKPSASGTPTTPKWRSVILKDGDVMLKPDGVRELDLEIQSYRDSCDLNIIIKRFLNGDLNAIPDPSKAVFADLMDMPQTRMQVLQSVIDAQRAFEQLPLDVRQKFNNSWEQFYVAFENTPAVPVKPVEPIDEVKE